MLSISTLAGRRKNMTPLFMSATNWKILFKIVLRKYNRAIVRKWKIVFFKRKLTPKYRCAVRLPVAASTWHWTTYVVPYPNASNLSVIQSGCTSKWYKSMRPQNRLSLESCTIHMQNWHSLERTTLTASPKWFAYQMGWPYWMVNSSPIYPHFPCKFPQSVAIAALKMTTAESSRSKTFCVKIDDISIHRSGRLNLPVSIRVLHCDRRVLHLHRKEWNAVYCVM